MKGTVEVWIWIVAGIIAGLLILTLGYSYSLQMINTVTEQSVLEQYDELYTQTNELCWSYLGNQKEANLILNKNIIGIYLTSDQYGEYNNTDLIDSIIKENVSSGDFLCIKIKNKKTICKQLDCNARIPFLGAVPIEFSLTSLINQIKGNPESFEYNLILKRDNVGVNITKINIKTTNEDFISPIIQNAQINPTSGPMDTVFIITAEITDSSGVNATTTIAHIQNPDETDIALITLYDDGLHSDGAVNDNIYGNTWDSTGFPLAPYYVDITACDILGNCRENENI